MTQVKESTARLEWEWGGEERVFFLKGGEIRKLQIETKFGVQKLLERIVDGDWFIDEIVWILRLALEGGGTDPKKAKQDVERYLLDGNGKMEESLIAAKLALYAVLDSLKAVDMAKKAKAMKTTTAKPT